MELNGVTYYIKNTTKEVNLNMLLAGRIEGWFTSDMLLDKAVSTLDNRYRSEIAAGEVRDIHCVYIVTTLETDDVALTDWRQAYYQLESEGVVEQILKRYLGSGVERLRKVPRGAATCM